MLLSACFCSCHSCYTTKPFFLYLLMDWIKWALDGSSTVVLIFEPFIVSCPSSWASLSLSRLVVINFCDNNNDH